MEELISQINQLANKKKTVGLTEDELVLQKKLREEYLKIFRLAMRGHIEGLKIVDESGADITPDKLKEIQRDKGLHNRHLEEQ